MVCGERCGRRSQQHGRLARGEAQILGTDLDELIPDAESAEAERWVDSRRQHHRQFRRAEVDQTLHPAVHAVAVDQVVVVDHDHELLVVVDQLVHQRGHDHAAVALRADHERRHPGTEARTRSPHRFDDRRPEPGGVGVTVLHLEPSDANGLSSRPRREQRRLAGPCRGADQDEWNVAVDAAVEHRVEAGSFDEARRRCRRTQSGRRDSELVVQRHLVRTLTPRSHPGEKSDGVRRRHPVR